MVTCALQQQPRVTQLCSLWEYEELNVSNEVFDNISADSTKSQEAKIAINNNNGSEFFVAWKKCREKTANPSVNWILTLFFQVWTILAIVKKVGQDLKNF